MVSFPDAVTLFFQRYVDFQGRSRRSEFWWVVLFFYGIVAIGVGIGFAAGGFSNGEPNAIGLIMIGLVGLFVLACIIPLIALQVRRFHDLNQTGWLVLAFYVAGFIPIVSLVSGIAQIVWFCFPGTQGPNKYGPDPKGGLGPTTAATFE
ncbi:MAG: DUF805 domain-containing protein [Hyphomonadaceae bacterium]|nr:DUF805 domain-containing protein [Hyphomonadaceae bacterium]